MGRNFFFMLSETEKEIEGKGVVLITAFNRLVSFVESGVWTSSPSSKYIAKNWRLTSKELCIKWNNEEVSEKSENTFRSQVSTLSRQLYALFPQVEKAFIDDDKKAIQEILGTIDLLSDGDEFYNDLFVAELVEDYSDYSGREYSLEDCMNEIHLLAMLRKRYLFEMLDLVNRDKMGYLHKVLQTPVASMRYRTINSKKLKVLNMMEEAGASTTLFDGAAQNIEKVQEPAKVDNNLKYRFSDMRELVDVLEKVATSENMGIDAEKDAKKLSAIKRLYCADDLKCFLGDVSAETMQEFLKGMELKTK
ncbi:MAG: hypothetical protein J6B50_04605 [Lachnospiraceae bacterium]|nr:hypothetical protein [Lachnospiraceae bacterium]